MDKILILITMIFLHIVDDYYFQQGVLAKLKQKKWWEDNAPTQLYKYDYIVALFMHSFSWAFMIMLPIFFYHNWILNGHILYYFILNMLMHAWTDDTKCNKGKINLITDQTIHLIQIVITFICLII